MRIDASYFRRRPMRIRAVEVVVEMAVASQEEEEEEVSDREIA
jgi:hypothetical protein